MATSLKLPTWFWIVAIAAILWNVLGVSAYIMEVTMSEEALAALPDAERALYERSPAWVTGAFAVAVFAGLIGSITLALRKEIATPILVTSLVAVILQMGYQFGVADIQAVMGASSMVMPAVIVVIAVLLVWLSVHAKNRGWMG